MTDPVYQRLVTQFLDAAQDYFIHSEVVLVEDIGYSVRFLEARNALRAALASPPPDEPSLSTYDQFVADPTRKALLEAESRILDLEDEIAKLRGAPPDEPPHCPHGVAWTCQICVARIEREKAAPPDERDLRQMFSDGIDVARSYGDNAFHLHTDQLERQFQVAHRRMRAGKMQNVQPSAAPPDEPEAHPAICGVKGDPPLGPDRIHVCELQSGHEGHHRDGRVTWIGYYVPAEAHPRRLYTREEVLSLGVDETELDNMIKEQT